MQIFMKGEQKQLYLDALYYHLIRGGYSKWMAKKTVEQFIKRNILPNKK